MLYTAEIYEFYHRAVPLRGPLQTAFRLSIYVLNSTTKTSPKVDMA